MRYKMENGQKVRLSKKAVKQFYGRNENLDGFFVGGELSTEHFLQFVDHYLGFDNGKNTGVVIGRGSEPNTIRVRFQSPTGNEEDSYYAIEDLIKVK